MSDYPDGENNVEPLGDRHFVMPTDRDRRGFFWWHDCTGRSGWGWFGAVEAGASGHKITSSDPLTVQGSLLCTVCGDHGFIRDGRWAAA